jgi:hypothetical protein
MPADGGVATMVQAVLCLQRRRFAISVCYRQSFACGGRVCCHYFTRSGMPAGGGEGGGATTLVIGVENGNCHHSRGNSLAAEWGSVVASVELPVAGAVVPRYR